VPRSPLSGIDPRRWFDRGLPQTLQIALWLLYVNGAFTLAYLLDQRDYVGALRSTTAFGFLWGLVIVAAHAGGGFLMANGRRLGHLLAILAAFSPFLLRWWVLWQLPAPVRITDVVTGRDTLSFLFEIALVALVLHPQSREHVRRWMR
jgi:hypothetical protein